MYDEQGRAATQVLISHLCHELVSPIGAVNNGVELLEESLGEGIEKEALDLIGESARLASSRLRFYRLAYGRAGAGADLQATQAETALAELIQAEARTTLTWRVARAAELAPGGYQLVLNLALLGAQAMPRGGTLKVELAEPAGDGIAALRITATGAGARVADAVQAALADADTLPDHTSVHAWWCGALARRLGVAVAVVSSVDPVGFAVQLPGQT